jgi:DNA polymerase-3 subunit beta
MKIRVKRDALLEGCRLAERALAERVVEPALAHLLVEARAGGVLLQTTDTEVALRLEVAAEVERPGRALLPGRRTVAVLREADADELAVEAVPGRVLVRGLGVEFDLVVPEAGRFPAPEPFPGGGGPRLEAGRLRRAIQGTLFAAGGETARYNLEGVLWEVEPDRVRLVATDNRRLAVAEVPVLGWSEHLPPAQRLLPARAMDVLARLATDEPVEVLFGMSRAFFRAGPAMLCARYGAGPYPAWRRAIPDRPRHTLPVPVGPFLSGVRQAAVLREREDARLLLRFEAGRLLMESRQAGAGQSRVEQPLPFAGEPVQIALNPRFLVEMLRACDPDATLQLELTGPDTAALFRAGADYQHVLMPLRLG